MKDYNTVILAKAKKVMGDYNSAILSSNKEETEKNNNNAKRTGKVNNRVNRTKNITEDNNTVVLAEAKKVMGDYNSVFLDSNK